MFKFYVYKLFKKVKKLLKGGFSFSEKYVYATNSNSQYIKEKYKGLRAYNLIVNNFVNEDYKKTSNPISLLGISLGSLKKDLLKQLGIPRASINVKSSSDIQILYYRKHFAKEKAKIEFHFYKKRLFYINVKFSQINQSVKKDILNVFEKKYGGTILDKIAYKNDSNEALVVHNNISLVLNYLSLDSGFIEDLNEKNEIAMRKHLQRKDKYLNSIQHSF